MEGVKPSIKTYAVSLVPAAERSVPRELAEISGEGGK